MNDFLAGIDRRKFVINLVGYMLVLALYLLGPPLSGFTGGLARAYLWFFPVYYAIYLVVIHLRNRQGEKD